MVDATTVLVTHLSETIKQQAADILSRQDVQHLLDNLKETHATVINELILLSSVLDKCTGSCRTFGGRPFHPKPF